MIYLLLSKLAFSSILGSSPDPESKQLITRNYIREVAHNVEADDGEHNVRRVSDMINFTQNSM
jgi:hypothetical protein